MAKTFTKFCGFTRNEDLDVAIGLGLDALGFIAFPKSARHLSAQAYQKLSEHVHVKAPQISKVLVTVNAEDEFLKPYLDAGVDALQLHGREDANRITQIRQFYLEKIYKAVTLSQESDIAKYQDLAVDAFIIDAQYAEGEVPGGSGKKANWALAAKFVAAVNVPVYLAGGISADNLVQAQSESHCDGFDLSSGIEDSPGIKSADKMKAFMQAVAKLG